MCRHGVCVFSRIVTLRKLLSIVLNRVPNRLILLDAWRMPSSRASVEQRQSIVDIFNTQTVKGENVTFVSSLFNVLGHNYSYILSRVIGSMLMTDSE